MIETSVVNPLKRTFDLLGDGWTFFILRECFFGARRFEEFRTLLDIPRSRLTERLSHLVSVQILQKRKYESRPPRYEYLLSEAGHDIYDMTLMMKQWGDVWRPQGLPPRIKLVHRECNSVLHPMLVCKSCNNELRSGHLEIDVAPSFSETVFAIRRKLPLSAFQQDDRNDSVARTLAVIGDQWSMAIVSEALFGHTNTFNRFIENLNIARKTLSSRLKHLQEEKILTKVQYQTHPPRYIYKLTDSGESLISVIYAMYAWGTKWAVPSKKAPPLTHTDCSDEFHGQMLCRKCQLPVNSHNVDYQNKHSS